MKAFPEFSVLTPICSSPPEDEAAGPRPTLERYLDSILRSRFAANDLNVWLPSVEILLGLDGPRPRVQETVEAWCRRRSVPLRVWGSVTEYEAQESVPIEPVRAELFTFPFRGRWGHAQINDLLPLCRGELIVMCDDDDAFLDDSLRQTYLNAQRWPGRPMLAQMRVWQWGGDEGPRPEPDVLWKEAGRLEEGHVGGHMLIVPNEQALLGRRTDRYAADFDFVLETVERFRAAGRPEVWVEGFIADVRLPL